MGFNSDSHSPAILVAAHTHLVPEAIERFSDSEGVRIHGRSRRIRVTRSGPNTSANRVVNEVADEVA
jgi:hypothetical protein